MNRRSPAPARRLLRSAVSAALAVLVISPAARVASAAPPPLPPPGAPAPQAPQAAPAPAASAAAAKLDAAAAPDPRRGIVGVEKDGKSVGVGTVLDRDGRVLTALSTLGGADEADIRYADGTVVRGRVGHKDAAWDLVLLIPQAGKWLDGLRASELDPAAVEIRTFQPGKPKAAVVVAKVRGRSDAHAKGGESLPRALDVDVRAVAPLAGAPLVDATGTVLGVLVHVCKGIDAAAACTPALVGAPVAAVRSFLLRTPANAVAPSPFLGIVGASEPATSPMKGVRVVDVAAGSPAEKGALKPNVDVIVAVDGKPVESPEKLSEVVTKHAVGDVVKLLVYGAGQFREVQVALRAAP